MHMAHSTGIEVGPASCVLVRARRGTAGVGGVRVVERPAGGPALVAALRAARFAGQLPRRARVVSWGLSPSGAQDDPASESVSRLLADAGFRVEAMITPAEALVRLAASSGRTATDSPVAWVSIHIHGAAIAIVRRSQLLYSRTLTWKYEPAARTPREQLLQRYLLIAHLAPELQRGMTVVHTNSGSAVESVVTCGDLPDLRALTLPLQEELGLYVETLDSTPANRLAGVAALMPVGSSRPTARRAGIAAALAMGALLLAGYAWFGNPADRPALPATHAVATPQRDSSSVPKAPSASAPTSTSDNGPVGSFGSALGETKPASLTLPASARALPPPPFPTSILIAGDRRLAMMGGCIVAVGDRVGPRLVVGIHQQSVTLRDPSGREATVFLQQAPRLP